jgi:hypothetical protein
MGSLGTGHSRPHGPAAIPWWFSAREIMAVPVTDAHGLQDIRSACRWTGNVQTWPPVHLRTVLTSSLGQPAG